MPDPKPSEPSQGARELADKMALSLNTYEWELLIDSALKGLVEAIDELRFRFERVCLDADGKMYPADKKRLELLKKKLKPWLPAGRGE